MAGVGSPGGVQGQGGRAAGLWVSLVATWKAHLPEERAVCVMGAENCSEAKQSSLLPKGRASCREGRGLCGHVREDL